MYYLNGVKKEDHSYQNNAFWFGDAVKVYFFVRQGKLLLAEECYFFLMASMRKMRMNIPLTFTLEFFSEMFQKAIDENQFQEGIIALMTFRNRSQEVNAKTKVEFYFEFQPRVNFLEIQQDFTLDIIKEVTVNHNLLSNIHTHRAEDVYASIYARENDLDDVILLNPDKRIARTIWGNLLLLEGDCIKIPKASEGAFISPLMENLVTFIYKNQWATIEEAELNAFETQKAEEILLISDEKGIFSVHKIRNKSFNNNRFSTLLKAWKENLSKT